MKFPTMGAFYRVLFLTEILNITYITIAYCIVSTKVPFGGGQSKYFLMTFKIPPTSQQSFAKQIDNKLRKNNATSLLFQIISIKLFKERILHIPSAACWKLTYAYPKDLLVTKSRQTRMDKIGPTVENFSNKTASVTSGWRSPT